MNGFITFRVETHCAKSACKESPINTSQQNVCCVCVHVCTGVPAETGWNMGGYYIILSKKCMPFMTVMELWLFKVKQLKRVMAINAYCTTTVKSVYAL
jgi:hypothetical protein